MIVLQPVQPYSPTFFKNLTRGWYTPVQKSVGGAGCSGCKIPGWVRERRGRAGQILVMKIATGAQFGNFT